MKIVNYKLYKVPPRWLFLKIETNDGLFGWGEPIVEGKADTVEKCVEELMSLLIGKNPLRIEDHWNTLFRGNFYRGGPILMSAISGIDQALWDIKGKYFQAPVYELIGGKCRDKIRTYSWVGGDKPNRLIEEVERVKNKGFTTIKMNATEELQIIDSFSKIEKIIHRVASLREKFGYSIDIALDFHGRVHKPMAKVLAKELEQFKPLFIEEPVIPENNEVLKYIANISNIPIATGERMYSRWDFKHLLSSGYIDIIQPDLSHAGGITECKKIASMAEAYDVALAPHCPLGPIALASCLQVDATAYNAFIQEQSLGIHYNVSNDLLDYLEDPSDLKYEDGFLMIPDKPGLGIEINEEMVKRKSLEGHSWKNPVWRHEDGSVAEW